MLVAPLAEELAFRGFLIRRLIAADVTRVPAATFTWFSFVLSSALFGALHGRWLAATAAGLIYAIVWYRRGRLIDCVGAHATTNLLLMLYLLFVADAGTTT